MGYSNNEQQKEYQKIWIARRKKKYIDELGSCKKCGSLLDLELHHTDPSTKIKISWSWSDLRLRTEIAKCIILCKICHKWVTNEQTTKPIEHGSSRGYDKGCRCTSCVIARKDTSYLA